MTESVLINGVSYDVVDVDPTEPRRLIVQRPRGYRRYLAWRCDPAHDSIYGAGRATIAASDRGFAIPLRFVREE